MPKLLVCIGNTKYFEDLSKQYVLVLVTVMTIVQDLPTVAGSKSSEKAAEDRVSSWESSSLSQNRTCVSVSSL